MPRSEPSETVSSDTARMVPERTTLGESVKIAATVSPTESEIAAVAYQLWVHDGCRAGSDREDWFRAEAMLKDSPVAKCEGLSTRPPTPSRDTRTESEMLLTFRWGVQGHWEVWKANGAALGGPGMRPLPPLEFRIGQAERTPAVATRLCQTTGAPI
jgi:hypothetical protein